MKKILLLVAVSFTVLCADAQYDKKEFKAKFHDAFDSISSEYPNYPFALKLFKYNNLHNIYKQQYLKINF